MSESVRFIVALCLCVTCLVLAVIFIKVEKDEHYVTADIIKGCASLCFVLVGFLGLDGFYDAYGWPIVYGLTLGMIADILLNLRYVFEGKAAQRAFLVGILVFFLGHIVYVCALAGRCDYLMPCVIIGIILGIGLLVWIFGQIECKLVFKVFGFFYVCTIAVMNVVAIGALITKPGVDTVLFVIGAILFLVSDILLTLNTFGPNPTFRRRVANLMLYYMGQLLIALSIFFTVKI